MSELLYKSATKFSWYLLILLGIFIMIAGIDLLILLINSYNLIILIIVSVIYGAGTIIILISILGIYIVKKYGIKGDIILRSSIAVILGVIPIIIFLVIKYIPLAIIFTIFLILYIVGSILEIKRIQKQHLVNPEDELRIMQFIGDIVLVISGIILIPLGIYVNYLILRFLPGIYSIGSYGFAFLITGGILIFSVIFSLYRKHKEKKEKTKEIKEKFDLKWLRHQYYDLGRSIQEIAEELNESMITIRKLLENIDKPAK